MGFLVLSMLCTGLALGPLLGPPRVRVVASVSAERPVIDRRVAVDIVHTATPDFLLYAREAGRMLKMLFPDVDVNQICIPVQQGAASAFKIVVDELPVYTKRSDASGVALKMSTLSAAVKSARRRRSRLSGSSLAAEPLGDSG
ncbi:hypothetical protein T492DRAFT_1107696 [Pavlovales sp. CCMP2436]|nr:hypothetical protein T492DRAFT_1107696 [Pavlovales sp. CCMP2436]|mmetsp:Transcript_22429/g.56913  ORF Transcript_22429/g.56913 Transcript_22429/m.56913 type:complete len:143 (+) Transcript_22429:86-514(+)